MSRTKPAEVRFYVDADLLGLARVLAGLRPDVTYPGDPGAVIHKRLRPACPITSPAVKDSEWILEVARRGWLIITRDRHIQAHRLEIQAVRQHKARMVALNREDASSVFAHSEGFAPPPRVRRATRPSKASVERKPQCSDKGAMEVYGNLNDTMGDSISVYVKGLANSRGHSTVWNNITGTAPLCRQYR